VKGEIEALAVSFYRTSDSKNKTKQNKTETKTKTKTKTMPQCGFGSAVVGRMAIRCNGEVPPLRGGVSRRSRSLTDPERPTHCHALTRSASSSDHHAMHTNSGRHPTHRSCRGMFFFTRLGSHCSDLLVDKGCLTGHAERRVAPGLKECLELT